MHGTAVSDAGIRPGSRASGALPWWSAAMGALCLAVFAAQRTLEFNLHDEGFLWYGAQRVLAGELPLRDFQAYDPGRYFWVAGWMALLGDDGFLAMRWANAALAAITVALAVWTVGSGLKRPGAAVLMTTGATFTLWMVPRYKPADAFAAVLLLFGLARLLRRPSPARYFVGGVCLGLASTIGINHALYGSVAALLAFARLRGAPDPRRAAAAAVAGGLVGYSPVLALHLFAPGFSAAFLDGVRQLSENGGTNLALPWPDPLAVVRRDDIGLLRSATESVVALLLLAFPLFWARAAWAWRAAGARAADPTATAGLILSAPYAHYALSRPDVAHLAVSILPVLAAALIWTASATTARRRLALAAIGAAGLLATAREHPVYYLSKGLLTHAVPVDGSRMLVGPDDAREALAARAVAASAGPAPFFAGPYTPGAYALARRRAPVWEIYMIFPSPPARQRAEIARLERAGVRHALLSDERVDRRPDLGLDRTHPLLFAHLSRLGRAEPVPGAPGFTIRRP